MNIDCRTTAPDAGAAFIPARSMDASARERLAAHVAFYREADYPDFESWINAPERRGKGTGKPSSSPPAR